MCLKNNPTENSNFWCFFSCQQKVIRLCLDFSLLSNLECLIFSEHSLLQREALQQENTGWLGQLGLWFIPARIWITAQRTNKDYSVSGIFPSLNLANIFQLVPVGPHNGQIKILLWSVFRMNDSQYEPGQSWDIDEFDPSVHYSPVVMTG